MGNSPDFMPAEIAFGARPQSGRQPAFSSQTANELPFRRLREQPEAFVEVRFAATVWSGDQVQLR